MRSVADRSNAEFLFVRQGKTLEEIAERAGISRGTLGRWSKAGKWTARRAEFLRESPAAPLEKLKRRRERLIAEMADDPNADPIAEDRLAKLQRIIDRLEIKDAIGPALDVMERFARFVAQTSAESDRSDVETIRKWTEKFLDQERRENA